MSATLDADPIHWRDSKIDLNSSMVERVPEKDKTATALDLSLLSNSLDEGEILNSNSLRPRQKA
ncbi:hypothetical protein HDF11_004187 [Tunturiibacter psychrotolerans]